MNRPMVLSVPVEQMASFDWFVAVCDRGQEMASARALISCFYSVFLPLEGRWRKKHRYAKGKGSKTLRHFAIAPGYIFVAAPKGQQVDWTAARSHCGVRKVLAVAVDADKKEPARAHVGELEKLARRCEDCEFYPPDHHKYVNTGEEYAVGDRVRVFSGALRDLELVVQRIVGDTVTVSTELLGGQRAVSVEASSLARAA